MLENKIELKDFDISEYLDTPESITDFINDAVDSGDNDYMIHALEVVTKIFLKGKI